MHPPFHMAHAEWDELGLFALRMLVLPLHLLWEVAPFLLYSV
jgi:hypothetical protein